MAVRARRRSPTAGSATCPDLLEPGDLVVVNTSATLPGAARRPAGRRRRRPAARVDGPGRRRLGGRGAPSRTTTARTSASSPGTVLALPGGVRLTLLAGFPDPARPSRLWRARAEPAGPTTAVPAGARAADPLRLPARHVPAGRVPERVRRPSRAAPRWPAPGGRSPSGCSSRSWPAAIPVVPVVLHTGVSSPELHEPPYPERFAVPEVTARLVTATRRAGGRVVAVGTTVTRALETATDDDGVTRRGRRLDRPRARPRPAGPDGHRPGHRAARARGQPPAAARGGRRAATWSRPRTGAAVAEHYLWHEFGDSMLFLP